MFKNELKNAHHLLTRKMTDKNKLYSLHEESVECIAKGKAHKRYEFGCKVSLSITHKGKGVVTSSHALHGNPFDGHTLKADYFSSNYLTTNFKPMIPININITKHVLRMEYGSFRINIP